MVRWLMGRWPGGLNYFEYGMRIYERNNAKTSLRWNNMPFAGFVVR